ncbi:ABC transporter substrate-binding protein [Spirulina sp. CS-785/01]|uniref:ABC transporter substrate-binding protein n=1 Tax=Spirulina sp. CS-785/01 TaxID=3021716 RepID=UPI00232D0481|nr:ABC transporter substrate-binding protein [Spirulina sp. CS-785/01]MDB9313279.1 ABC transporter substrate-binding protein [Spirulina sp. CS-785/01]
MKCDRRRFLQLLSASTGFVLTTACNPQSANGLPTLGISGSPILMSIPLAYLMEKSRLSQVVADLEFIPIRNHEQIKALLTSEQAKISPNPTLLSAGLYQQDIPIKLLNVMIWGNIYLMSPDSSLMNWEDLAGKSILIPFKGSMPEMLFRYLITQSGLNPDQDLTLQSTQDFQSTAQLLLSGQGDAGVFAEPQASSVRAKGQQQDIELFYNLDFKTQWAAVTGQPPRYPQAGISIVSSFLERYPDVVEVIESELENSLSWISENPSEAAQLGSKYMDIPPQVIEQSLQNNLFEYVPAREAKGELEVFFKSLMQVNPKLLKGELPKEQFYKQPAS